MIVCMHCILPPDFFYMSAMDAVSMLYSSPPSKVTCTIYSMYCVAVGMTVGLLQGTSPLVYVVFLIFESLSEGAHAWCGTIGMGIHSLPLDSTLWDHMQSRDTPHRGYVWPCSCIVKAA